MILFPVEQTITWYWLILPSKIIAELICDVLDNESRIEATGKKVRELCCKYPLYIGS